MKTYILITGASAGIGYAMSQQLAAKKFNLILVARSTDKLMQMQTALSIANNIDVHYIQKDLSKPESAIELFNEVKSQKYIVTHLVNNAGFGGYGNFLETSLKHELNMINLNVSSLVVLTKLFAQDMSKRKSGRIMNVASILSFLPFPYYSIYSSTKTFVLSFSETIAAELEGSGVVVTALCPGTVERIFTPRRCGKQTQCTPTNRFLQNR